MWLVMLRMREFPVKKIQSLTFKENHDKGEMAAIVFRGHASVRVLLDCFEAGQSLDLWLMPSDAMQLASAILAAAKEIESAESSTPSFDQLG
jgi:hypothetical protein